MWCCPLRWVAWPLLPQSETHLFLILNNQSCPYSLIWLFIWILWPVPPGPYPLQPRCSRWGRGGDYFIQTELHLFKGPEISISLNPTYFVFLTTKAATTYYLDYFSWALRPVRPPHPLRQKVRFERGRGGYLSKLSDSFLEDRKDLKWTKPILNSDLNWTRIDTNACVKSCVADMGVTLFSLALPADCRSTLFSSRLSDATSPSLLALLSWLPCSASGSAQLHCCRRLFCSAGRGD